MARKIEVGLELTGQDAIDFLKYLENPEYTPSVMEMLNRAYEMAQERAKKGSQDSLSD
jgi:hypothetical protein